MIEFSHVLPKHVPNVDREAFLLERCAGKRVLHLGCVDADLTAGKLETGALLHSALQRVSKRVYGVDVDEKGLAIMREHRIPDLFKWSVTDLDRLQLDGEVDVVVAGEIVEHLGNMDAFLEGARAFVRRNRAELIITTPNAYGWRAFSALFGGVEEVHPDHNYYFSFVTLRNMLEKKHGFSVVDTAVYSLPRLRLSSVGEHYRSRLGRRNRESTNGSAMAAPVTANPGADETPGFGQRVLRHAMFVGGALANPVLTKINPFFADGLILVAR